MTTHCQHPTRGRRGDETSAEEGSAILVALLGMVVLTVLGLGLSLITQTEMKLGANEQTLQRSFYAADSGFSSSVSRALVQADFEGKVIEMPDPGAAAAFNFRHEIDVSNFFPVLTSPCNLCQINNAGTYGVKQYFKISHAVSSVAERKGGSDANSTTVAQKTLSMMVDLQPTESTPEAHMAIDDPDKVARILF